MRKTKITYEVGKMNRYQIICINFKKTVKKKEPIKKGTWIISVTTSLYSSKY